jgi:hypothetical protein
MQFRSRPNGETGVVTKRPVVAQRVPCDIQASDVVAWLNR